MIMSIEQLRELVPSIKEKDDKTLQAQLEAFESLIRNYTNNKFQKRNIRSIGSIVNGELVFDTIGFKLNDTIEISQSKYNDGVYVYGMNNSFSVDEDGFFVTKIEYPKDVVLGVANLIKWENEHRDKVGVQSETLSRYSVTYFNMDASNSLIGYPTSLVSFLKPYMKARF